VGAFVSRFYFALFLMLAVPSQVMAITVYDVIQLSKKSYSDQDIIALIEATDSAFELQADDISRLAELGISEPVIQAMLKAVPTGQPAEHVPDRAPGQYVTNPEDNQSGHVTAIAGITSDKLVARAEISLETMDEPGSGRHHHQVITVSGIQLLVLRDEGAYSSVIARARAVADNLGAVSALDGGQFQPVHAEGRDAVMFTATGTSRSIIVVSVSARDASAYQRRSGRRVTPDLLAAYWSDLLADYWSLALDGCPPDRLANLHDGEALQELYDMLDVSIANKADRLSGAFQSLPNKEQEHLLRLAVSVPGDYKFTDEHTRGIP